MIVFFSYSIFIKRKSATIRGELSLISAVKNEIIVKAAVGYTHVLLLNDQGQLFVL
jgi:hypothetical protein